VIGAGAGLTKTLLIGAVDPSSRENRARGSPLTSFLGAAGGPAYCNSPGRLEALEAAADRALTVRFAEVRRGNLTHPRTGV